MAVGWSFSVPAICAAPAAPWAFSIPCCEPAYGPEPALVRWLASVDSKELSPMNGIASKAPKPQASESLPRTLLASRRHTLIFFAICLAVTVVSALNANRGSLQGAPTGANPNQMLQLYLLLIGMEWLWVRFVFKGMQAHGRSLFEFIGQPWFTPRQLAGDLMYAALALGFSYALFIGIDGLLQQHGEAVTTPLLPGVPSAAAGIIVWIGLSLSAGICE